MAFRFEAAATLNWSLADSETKFPRNDGLTCPMAAS
jgi:hypothetical protein